MKIKIKMKIKITHACRQRQIVDLVLIWIHTCGS